MKRDELLAMHLSAEQDGERSPAYDPLTRYEAVRDQGNYARAKRFNVSQLKHMSQIERAQLNRWLEAHIREFKEKSALLERHMQAQTELPECWLNTGISSGS